MSENKPDYNTHIQQIAKHKEANRKEVIESAPRRSQMEKRMRYQGDPLCKLYDHELEDDKKFIIIYKTEHTAALKAIG